jgi:hypothetical protein
MLRKIASGKLSLTAKRFDYDSLSGEGNLRWIVTQNRTKKIVVLDTQTDSFKAIGKHDSAVVLPDGKLLTVDGATMTIRADTHTPTANPKRQLQSFVR